jgi:tape measure domain-containing protein
MEQVFKEIFDDSEIIASLNRIEKEIGDIETASKDMGKAMQDAFTPDSALGVSDALKDLNKKYDELKNGANVLKAALKGATDPTAIKLYTKSIAELENGMEQLEKAGKAAGVTLGGVAKEAATATKEASTGKQVFGEFFGQFTKVALIVEAIRIVSDLVKTAVSLSVEVERASKSFEAFLGDAEKAKKVIGELTSFANAKFLNQNDVFQAGKALLAFGESAENLTPVLGRIADISAATGKNFNELTTIYGKARTAGVLYAEDINQLVDAGIPIIQEFAKQMGVSNDQVKKLASEGKISFEELQLAFFNLTGEGGKFFGQVGTQAETLGGQWDKLTTNFKAKLKSVGDALQPILVGALKLFNALLNVDPTGGVIAAKEKAKTETDRTFKELLSGEVEFQSNILRVNKTADAERNKLETAAAERRKQLGQKANVDAAKLEQERQRLLIEAMKEGQEKDIAAENLRFKELSAQLKKFHIDTTQAEEEHQKNILSIKFRYLVDRVMAAEAADKAEQDAIKRGFAELEGVEKENAARREAGLARNSEARKQAAALEKELFEGGLLAAKEAFFSKKRTDEEIKKYEEGVAKARELFQLAQQQEELRRTLEFDSTLSNAEKAVLQERIKNIQTEIDQASAGVGDKKDGGAQQPKSIWSLFGFDEKEGEALGVVTEQVISALNEVAQAQVDAAARQVEALDGRIAKQEEVISREAELAKEGVANDLATEKAKLAELKKQRDAAAKEEAKARRAQILLDSVQQLSSLITASANIFKSLSELPFGLGVPVAIGLIGVMFGAFIAAKAKALSAASAPKLRKGGRLQGPTHEAGGVPIHDHDGNVMAIGEGKEWVIATSQSIEHDRFLARLNKGEFKGVNLDAITSDKKRLNPASEAVPRIREIERQKAEVGEAQHWQAMKAAYSEGAEKIVKAIDGKPTVYPWKNGYIKETKRGNVHEKRKVLPE